MNLDRRKLWKCVLPPLGMTSEGGKHGLAVLRNPLSHHRDEVRMEASAHVGREKEGKDMLQGCQFSAPVIARRERSSAS
jgi:hypothetical protein